MKFSSAILELIGAGSAFSLILFLISFGPGLVIGDFDKIQKFMKAYREMYDNAVSDSAKQKFKNLLEVYEIIDTDLAITHPRLNEIEFPDLASLTQGSTFPSE